MAIWQNDLSKDHTEKSPGISHGPGNNLTSGGKKILPNLQGVQKKLPF